MTQTCLTRWERTVQALETMGVIMQIQAETRRQETAQRRGVAGWAFLVGIALMGLVAVSAWGSALPPCTMPSWQIARACPAGAGTCATG